MKLAALSLFLATGIHAGEHPNINPCTIDDTFANATFCDSTLPIDTRIADMLSRMTMEEKISNLGNVVAETPSLGLPVYNWWSEATSGVGDTDKEMTKFAYPITTGMSFNRTMWKATGQQIGREARAAHNEDEGFSTWWTPVVNLAREPRWGRNIEVASEDPFHNGEYAVHFVKGFQESEDDLTHIQASACCKHFVANEMENSNEVGQQFDRQHVDSAVTMQDLVDSYMAPFQACVERGEVTGLMCSYNAVNGVPPCANDWLHTTVAREEVSERNEREARGVACVCSPLN